MNDNATHSDPQDASAVKARDFRMLRSDEAIRKHPDLVNAYAVLQAAALVAEIQLAIDADRAKFTSIMKETVAQQIEQRKPLPLANRNFDHMPAHVF